MCEWLSSEEWCDVYLICRGQIFRSHRAVLASVSTFLKDLLLSCPFEETPTFIVLPEFDIDTVSLVLYYIYNGEVVVKRNQMKPFLEIINTMQIFVDPRCLLKNNSFIQNGFDKYLQNIVPDYNTPISLCTNDEHEKFVNLKKDLHWHRMINKINSSPNITNLRKLNDVGYLKSQLKDRQKQSYPRDIFIEAYNLNGNSNGVAAGVLAMSNEHYRERTSGHLMNANVEHLTDNSLSEKSHITSTSDHIALFNHELHIEQDETYNISNTYNVSRCTNIAKSLKHINNKGIIRCEDENDTQEKYLSHKNQFKLTSFVEENSTHVNSNFDKDIKDYNNSPYSNISIKKKELKNQSENTYTRVTILNEVLQSPWRPILPYNFRPLSRRHYISDTQPSGDITKINDLATSTIVQLKEKESCEDKTDSIIIKCNICKQVFADKDAFVTHMRQHHSRYTCVECQKSFSQLRNFKYHMSVHRGTKEFATTCPICGKYFNDKGYLSSHMKIHRNRKEYKCSLCPKSFNQRVAYNMHVRIHSGVKPHVCDECGKAFSRKMLLKQHQRTHSGERPYACSHCDKRFADRSNMTLHLRLHTGMKPFSCTLCPKAFTKKHHLKTHLNFHTGDKPYSCPRCNLAFTQSSNMRTHYKKCNAQSKNDT